MSLRKLLVGLLSTGLAIIILLFLIGAALNKWHYHRKFVLHEPIITSNPAISAIPHHKSIERVLVLDGGGSHGIVELKVLATLEKLTGKPINQLFDVVVGASTGAIISTYLTVPNNLQGPKYTPTDLISLYADNLHRVLVPSTIRRFFTFSGLFNGYYSTENMNAVFHRYLGKARLNQSILPTIIPVFCAQHHQLMFFKSWCTNKTCDKHSFSGDFYSADVATASASIPVIFNPVEIYGDRKCQDAVDSAVFVNDPALYVLPLIDKKVKAKRYLIVDIGVNIADDDENSRMYQRLTGLYWLRHFVTINLGINARQATNLFKSRFLIKNHVSFWHLQVNLQQCANGLDVSKHCVDYLDTAGDNYVLRNHRKLANIAKQLAKMSA